MKKAFLLFCLLFSLPVFAQEFALKNNLAYDALRTPNLSLEFSLGKKWTLDTQTGMNFFFYTKKQLAAFFCHSPLVAEPFERIVLNKYREVGTVSELADLCNMSQRAFSRKFNEHFGEPPYQWLQKKRAEYIRDMINNPEISFKEIGFKLGFKTSSHFSSYCRRCFGMSPSQMRKQASATWSDK